MIRKILTCVVDAVSILIIIAALLVLLTTALTKGERAPVILGCSAFNVATASMEPELPVGAMILVRQTDPGEISSGDVISFYSADPEILGMVNTHRVIGITEDGGRRFFTTKGDASYVEDPVPVPEENLIGRVVASSLLLGRLASLMSNPLVFLPVILLPLFLILLMNVLDTVRITRRLAEEEKKKAIDEAIEQLRREQENAGTPETPEEKRESADAPEAPAPPEEAPGKEARGEEL